MNASPTQLIPFNHEAFGEIRTIVHNDSPWFVAADVCRILEHSNPTKALSSLDSDEKMTLTLSEGHSAGSRGGARSLNIVSESAFYFLVIRSRKPAAKAFRKWVTSEVLPSLRKTGSYSVPGASEDRIEDPFPVKMADIYSALKIEKPFLEWARFVCDAGFAEDEDYIILGAGEIHVTYEMAKHAALSADSSEGSALRQYFKACMRAGRRAQASVEDVLHELLTEVREIRLALVNQSAATAPAVGDPLHLPAQITPDDRDICQLIRWMVYYKLPACSFSEIAGFAQTMGLFGGRLDGRRDDEGRLECTARSRSAFGWILSRHKDCAYILEGGGAAALRIYGHGRGRRYHVERLDGVAVATQ